MREVFVDMKNEPCHSSDYKNCIKFVERCEALLEEGKFDMEGNDSRKRVRVAGAGPPKKVLDVRKQLFEYFVDVRTSLKGRLPTSVFLFKARFFYDQYCEQLRREGKELPKED